MLARALGVVSFCCLMTFSGMVFSDRAFGRTPDIPLNAVSDLLPRAEAVNDHLFDTLKSFTCDETIERFENTPRSSQDQQIDTITARVSFENGSERYSEIKQNDRHKATLANMSGAWSAGEFGTLLRQTRQLMAVETVKLRSRERLQGEWTNIYEFDVAEEDSPWELVVDSREYRIPFRSKLWISTETGEILRIVRHSLAIPAQIRISEVEWTLSLEVFRIEGSEWRLPAKAAYTISYGSLHRREWNRLTFSNYHRYGSEARLELTAKSK